MDELSDIKYFWRLENFCFCDLYSNVPLYSPVFTVSTPIYCRWSLYMFPNGHGIDRYIGIYLKRKRDRGPRKVAARFKISLLDSDGLFCPDAPSLEKTFRKGCEWGHNEFVRRSDIATGSLFLCEDTLTVMCQITILGQDLPRRVHRRQPSLQYGESEEINEVSDALNAMYKENLYTDMKLRGKNKCFNVHGCILRARTPQLHSKLQNSPDRTFNDDSTTEKFLSYIYNGKLDTRDFSPFDMKNRLSEYGLFHLNKSLFSQCKKYIAQTYFHLKKCIYSWKIGTTLLLDKEEIFSSFISGGSRNIGFQVCLYKNEDNIWRIKIKVSSSSNDDVFVRCNILVKDEASGRVVSDLCEQLCKSNSWWLCSTSMQFENNNLIFNDESCSIDSQFFCIDFIFLYPSGKIMSDLEMTISNHTSITDLVIDDMKKVLSDMERLYYDPYESDFTVLVGNREFKVHKCILCARSPYFRAMLKHDMSEKKKNQVDLKNEDLDERTFQEVIDKLFLFTYCGKFEARSPTFASLLVKAIDMYMIGKSYEDV